MLREHLYPGKATSLAVKTTGAAVVFILEPATEPAAPNSTSKPLKKPAQAGFFNGGSDGARTRDLLRDRQAL